MTRLRETHPPSSRSRAWSQSEPDLGPAPGVEAPILWLNPAQLVAFLCHWRHVVLLLGTSTPQNFLQPVARHFGAATRPRAGLAYFNIKGLADQAWILPLVRSTGALQADEAPRRGYYLFTRGQAVGFHPGLYDPRLDEKARRAEDLLRAGTGGAQRLSAAAQHLDDIAREAAELVILHFEGLLVGARPSQTDLPPMSADPYTVLDLPRTATKSEIKAAYHNKMREFHPDRVTGMDPVTQEVAHRRAQEINQAYQALRRLHGGSADSIW